MDDPNFKFLWYEDLVADLPSAISNLCEFAGYDLTPEQRSALVGHVSIENMREISREADFVPTAGDKIFRKGVVGDSKDYFRGDTLKVWDDWIAENIKGTGIVMPGV